MDGVFVGVCRIDIWLPESRSLKDKRRVVQSILQTLRQRLKVAAAETGGQQTWQSCCLAVACISGERHQVEGVLDSIVRSVEARLDLEITRIEREVL